jgi:hypothetical protein
MATSTTISETTTATSTHKPRVKRGGKPYTYHIESKTRPGIFHVVDCYRLTCSCEAGRHQWGCWHLRLGLAWHEWRTRQQARAAASTAPAAQTVAGIATPQEAVA